MPFPSPSPFDSRRLPERSSFFLFARRSLPSPFFPLFSTSGRTCRKRPSCFWKRLRGLLFFSLASKRGRNFPSSPWLANWRSGTQFFFPSRENGCLVGFSRHGPFHFTPPPLFLFSEENSTTIKSSLFLVRQTNRALPFSPGGHESDRPRAFPLLRVNFSPNLGFSPAVGKPMPWCSIPLFLTIRTIRNRPFSLLYEERSQEFLEAFPPNGGYDEFPSPPVRLGYLGDISLSLFPSPRYEKPWLGGPSLTPRTAPFGSTPCTRGDSRLRISSPHGQDR